VITDTKPPCTQVDPEIFFPVKGGSPRRAKQVCATCHIKDACAQHAIDAGRTLIGVWGATTEQERRDLRRGKR
jgi:WhiB family redox-sensing transcriptional regulator